MNKKITSLLILTSALLLTGCKTKEKHEYEYPDNPVTITFDYSNNETLKTELEKMYLVDSQEISTSQLSQFLEIVSKNDLYANRLEYQYTNKELYLAENDIDYIAGDFDYVENRVIERDNSKNSLSGTVSYHDQKWVETESHTVEHLNVTTTGTYSLIPNETTEVGTEKIDCDNDTYDSTKSIGYSQQLWSNQMNLTQSAKIGEKFQNVLRNVEERNETLPLGRRFKTNITSYSSNNSSKVVLTSVAKSQTTTGSELQVKYTVSVSVAGGMVVQTYYQYTEMEIINENEYFLKGESEIRNLSHI